MGALCFFAPAIWASRTSMVIIKAWIVMLIALTPPPNRNCRNMTFLNEAVGAARAARDHEIRGGIR